MPTIEFADDVMINPKSIEEIAKRLEGILPQGVEQIRDDVHKNLRVVLESGLRKANLVTREEFEVQSAVLARTREKLENLESIVSRLEQELGAHNDTDNSPPPLSRDD